MRAIQLVLLLSLLSFLSPCLVISNVQSDKCTPKDNTTYLFAYSNDLPLRSLLTVFDVMKAGYPVARQFVTLGRVRFDLQEPEKIEYFDNLNEFLSDANYSLPDPRLSYSSTSTGSDVISILEKFLENTQYPVCGSRINILVKRLPTVVDVESIVAKLRKFHVEVYFAISETVFGGNTLEALNEIAFKTNGLSVIYKDKSMHLGVYETQHYTKQTLIYAANFNVSGQGTVELPQMTLSHGAVSDAFQSSTFTCTNTIANNTFIHEYDPSIKQNSIVNYVRRGAELEKGIYSMKIEYKYANRDVERLFIRVKTIQNAPPADFWVPYDN